MRITAPKVEILQHHGQNPLIMPHIFVFQKISLPRSVETSAGFVFDDDVLKNFLFDDCENNIRNAPVRVFGNGASYTVENLRFAVHLLEFANNLPVHFLFAAAFQFLQNFKEHLPQIIGNLGFSRKQKTGSSALLVQIRKNR